MMPQRVVVTWICDGCGLVTVPSCVAPEDRGWTIDTAGCVRCPRCNRRNARPVDGCSPDLAQRETR